jgi:hypothetical protein
MLELERIVAVLLCAMVSACSSSDPPPTGEPDASVPACDDACFAEAMPIGTFVVDALTLAYADPVGDPNVVAGMNHDRRVTLEVETEPCSGPVDHRSPPPDAEEGVDSVFGATWVAVFGTGTADYAPVIRDGDLLLGLDVRDAATGRVVELVVMRTVDGGPPAFESARLAPGQTFLPIRSLGRLAGTVDAGRTRVGPRDTLFPFAPLSDVFVPLAGVRLYGDIDPTGIAEGVIGGGFLIEDAIDPLVAIDPTSLSEAVVTSVLEAIADLSPNTTGACRRVSAGWTFTAIPAVWAD